MTALVRIAEFMLGLYRLQLLMIKITAPARGEEERGGRNRRHKITAGFWTGLTSWPTTTSAMSSVARRIVAHGGSGIDARKERATHKGGTFIGCLRAL